MAELIIVFEQTLILSIPFTLVIGKIPECGLKYTALWTGALYMHQGKKRKPTWGTYVCTKNASY